MKYNTIYAFGGNNESGIRCRQIPVWRGLISIVLSVIKSGPNNYYGIDRIPVCTGSGMYRLHCITFVQRRPSVFHVGPPLYTCFVFAGRRVITDSVSLSVRTYSLTYSIDQTWLGVRCHPEGEFKPLLFSHSWTTQGPESPC